MVCRRQEKIHMLEGWHFIFCYNVAIGQKTIFREVSREQSCRSAGGASDGAITGRPPPPHPSGGKSNFPGM